MVEMVGRQDKMTHWKHDVHSVSRATTTKNVEASATQCRWRIARAQPLSAEAKNKRACAGREHDSLRAVEFVIQEGTEEVMSDGFHKRPVHHRYKTTSSVHRVMRSFSCMSFPSLQGDTLIMKQGISFICTTMQPTSQLVGIKSLCHKGRRCWRNRYPQNRSTE